jgi:hypothetical protein
MRRVLSLLLAFTSAACATVNHGPMQRIHVGSDPAGASVDLRDCGAGSTKTAKTPATVWVSRRATRCTLTFAADGYRPRTARLERRVADASANNFDMATELCEDDASNCNSLTDLFIVGAVAGVLVGSGLGIDAATGARWQQVPSRVDMTLQPEEDGPDLVSTP